MSWLIRGLKPGEHEACGQILRSLPRWFGIEQSILDYVQDVQTMETWILEVDETVAGFLTIKEHNSQSAEIKVLAVTEAFHGQGYGRRLVEHSERTLRSRGIEFLQVKTLGPSRPDPNYERTRGFYKQMGFAPLEENRSWGEANPCLILVKHLCCQKSSRAHCIPRRAKGTA